MASSTSSVSWYPSHQDPASSAHAPPQHHQLPVSGHHYSQTSQSDDAPMEQPPPTDGKPQAQAMVPVLHYNGSNGTGQPTRNGSPVGRPPSSASTCSSGSFHTAHTASTVHTAHTSHSIHPQPHHHPHHPPAPVGSGGNPSGHSPGSGYHHNYHPAGGYSSGPRLAGSGHPHHFAPPHQQQQQQQQQHHPQQNHGHHPTGLIRPAGRYPLPQRNGFGPQHAARPGPRMLPQQHFPQPQSHHNNQTYHGSLAPGFPPQPPMVGQPHGFPVSSGQHNRSLAVQQRGGVQPPPPPPPQSSGAQLLRQLQPGGVAPQDQANGSHPSNAGHGYSYPPNRHSSSNHQHPAGRPQGPPMHPERSPASLGGMHNGYLPHPSQQMNPNYRPQGMQMGNPGGMQQYDTQYDMHYAHSQGGTAGPYPPSQHHTSGAFPPPPPFSLRHEDQHQVPHMPQEYERRASFEASQGTMEDAQAISRSPSPPPAPPSLSQNSHQADSNLKVAGDGAGTADCAASVGSIDSLNRGMAQSKITRPTGQTLLPPGALGERGTNANNMAGAPPPSQPAGGATPKNKEDATADAASILLQLSSVVKSEGNSENENPQAVPSRTAGAGRPSQGGGSPFEGAAEAVRGRGPANDSPSARATPDLHDSAPDLTSEPSSDSIETLVDSEFPCPVPENYPTRLCLPCDSSKLNTLHCFLRSELLEIFVVEKSRNKSPAHSPGSSVGRVGLRCVHCAMARKQRDDRDEAPMAVFYPKSVAEIYRLVTSWQRCHLRKCRNLPPPVRSRWQALRDNDKSRGKTHYWVTSARHLGLADCNSRAGGVRFAPDFDASKLEGCVMSAGADHPYEQPTLSDAEAAHLATVVSTDSAAAAPAYAEGDTAMESVTGEEGPALPPPGADTPHASETVGEMEEEDAMGDSDPMTVGGVPSSEQPEAVGSMSV